MEKAEVIEWLKKYREIAEVVSADISAAEAPEVAHAFDDAVTDMKHDVMLTWEIKEEDLV